MARPWAKNTPSSGCFWDIRSGRCHRGWRCACNIWCRWIGPFRPAGSWRKSSTRSSEETECTWRQAGKAARATYTATPGRTLSTAVAFSRLHARRRERQACRQALWNLSIMPVCSHALFREYPVLHPCKNPRRFWQIGRQIRLRTPPTLRAGHPSSNILSKLQHFLKGRIRWPTVSYTTFLCQEKRPYWVSDLKLDRHSRFWASFSR